MDHPEDGRANEVPRRRAMIACEVCRTRKTRCDGAKPKCRLCSDLGAECVYREPAQKVDIGDRLILEQLQRIEHLLESGPSHTSSRVSPGHSSRHDDREPDRSSLFFKLVSWPNVRDLVTPSLDRGALLDAEITRPDLAIEQPSKLDVSQVPPAVDAYFHHIHPWQTLVHARSWNATYAAASLTGFTEGLDSCQVLLVAALGDHVAGATSRGPRDAARRIDEELFAHAMSLFPQAVLGNSITGAQCLILAASYLSRVRPLQAASICNLANEKLSLLHSSSGAKSDVVLEELKRLHWNLTLCRDDLTEVLDQAVKTAQPPYTVGLPEPLPLVPDEGMWRDDPTLLSAFCALHRTHQKALRFSTDGNLGIEMLFALALELETELNLWYDKLPDAYRFVESDFPTGSPIQLSLRFAFFACRASIFRPFVLAVLQDNSMILDPNISGSCKKSLEASVRQIEYNTLLSTPDPSDRQLDWTVETARRDTPHLRAAWSAAHNIAGETLFIMGATLSTGLAAQLPPPDDMSRLVRQVARALEQFADEKSSLQGKVDIIRTAEERRHGLLAM